MWWGQFRLYHYNNDFSKYFPVICDSNEDPTTHFSRWITHSLSLTLFKAHFFHRSLDIPLYRPLRVDSPTSRYISIYSREPILLSHCFHFVALIGNNPEMIFSYDVALATVPILLVAHVKFNTCIAYIYICMVFYSCEYRDWYCYPDVLSAMMMLRMQQRVKIRSPESRSRLRIFQYQPDESILLFISINGFFSYAHHSFVPLVAADDITDTCTNTTSCRSNEQLARYNSVYHLPEPLCDSLRFGIGGVSSRNEDS